MSHLHVKPTRHAVQQSRARIFVGQLEPYVTEEDLYPVFSCYGRVLHLNVVRHSTRVTPNEERRIPTAFVWYESTTEADAAIAALHNKFSFATEEDEGGRRRFIQVSYADKSPECTAYGHWQKRQAETTRRQSRDRPDEPYTARWHDGDDYHIPSSRAEHLPIAELKRLAASREEAKCVMGLPVGLVRQDLVF